MSKNKKRKNLPTTITDKKSEIDRIAGGATERFKSDESPVLSLQYLKNGGSCLNDVQKRCKNNKNKFKDFIDDFQGFLHDFPNSVNLTEAMKKYSPKGGSSSGKDNPYVIGIFNRFASKERFSEQLRYNVLSSIEHIHLHPQGNGKETFFGFTEKNTFYLIYIDIDHEVFKRK